MEGIGQHDLVPFLILRQSREFQRARVYNTDERVFFPFSQNRLSLIILNCEQTRLISAFSVSFKTFNAFTLLIVLLFSRYYFARSLSIRFSRVRSFQIPFLFVRRKTEACTEDSSRFYALLFPTICGILLFPSFVELVVVNCS